MKVREIIALLQGLDPELDVYVYADGDGAPSGSGPAAGVGVVRWGGSPPTGWNDHAAIVDAANLDMIDDAEA